MTSPILAFAITIPTLLIIGGLSLLAGSLWSSFDDKSFAEKALGPVAGWTEPQNFLRIPLMIGAVVVAIFVAKKIGKKTGKFFD